MPIKVMWQIFFKYIICGQYDVSTDKLVDIHYRCIYKRSDLNVQWHKFLKNLDMYD
jgi:hypothetical protein